MKNFKNLLLGCLIIFTIASCKKSEEEVAKQTDGTMTAKVDGKDWSATLAVQATKSSGVLAIGGTGSGGQININIINYTGVKGYALGGPTTNPNNSTWTVTAIPPVIYTNLMGQGTGEINITKEEGGYIEGNFTYSAKNQTSGASVSVTEGKFRAKLM